MMPKRLYYRFERWNENWGAALTLFMLAIVAVSITGTALIYVTRGNEQQSRLQAQANLLTCLDRYTKAQYTGSIAVREASANAQAAQDAYRHATARDDATQHHITTLFIEALAGKDVKAEAGPLFARKSRTEAGKRRASLMLDKANEALTLARANNPVPLPPSQFCRANRPASVAQQDVTPSPKAYPLLRDVSPLPTIASPSPAPSSVTRPPESTAPAQPTTPRPSSRPSSQPTPEPSPVQPTPSPTGGLVDLVDNTLKQLGLPPLLPTP